MHVRKRHYRAVAPSASATWAALAWVVCAGTALAGGPAVNQFETKDLEAEPGNIQFQSQNAFMVGNPRRKAAVTPGGETVFDNNSVSRMRLAQELEVHLTSFFRTRIGLELEKERLDDPASFDAANAYNDLRATELQFEGVAVLVPIDKKRGGVGMGLIAEYQHALVQGEAHTLYMGTILQAVFGPWSATTNLFAVRHFAPAEHTDTGGVIRDNKWDFAYAAQLKYHHSAEWDFAVEAYGTVDRIGNTGQRDEASLLLGDHDQHRIGPVVYRTFQLGGEKVKDRLGLGGPAGKVGSKVAGVADDDDKPRTGGKGKGLGAAGDKDDDDDEQPTARVGVGALAGVTPGTPKLTMKLSLEIDF